MNRYKSIQLGDITIPVPIIQGGMGVGISRSSLAGAVSLNNGLGVISAAQIGYDEEDYEANPVEANLRAVSKHIKKAKELARNAAIGINIMVATRYYERYVKAAVDAGVDIIISGAGLPIELPKLVEGSKTKIAPIVSSLKSAEVICRMWKRKYNKLPDMVIIEGPLAGGHLGFKKEEVDEYITKNPDVYGEEIKRIINMIRDYGKENSLYIPVIVAGGIYTDKDMHKAIVEYGADGVQVGTRFVTTTECDASTEYKNAYINCTKDDIVIVKSPVGMPGRAIDNAFLKRCKESAIDIKSKCYQCIKNCNRPDIPYCISKALINAVKGDLDNGLIFCGAKAYMCDKIENVRQVMDSILGYQI